MIILDSVKKGPVYIKNPRLEGYKK